VYQKNPHKVLHIINFELFTSDNAGGICDCPQCLSVCLCARLLKNVCMDLDEIKCRLSTGVGTWTNWLTFEPDPHHSPDAGTGFLSPIAYALQRGNEEFYYVGKIPCMYWYWGPIETATRGFEVSKHPMHVLVLVERWSGCSWRRKVVYSFTRVPATSGFSL